MKIALIGLPNSGKTTIFNALTKQEAPVTAYTNAKAEPNLAVVEVADDRISRLSEMYRPKKTIFTTIEFIDFVGVTEGSAKDGLFSPPDPQSFLCATIGGTVAENAGGPHCLKYGNQALCTWSGSSLGLRVYHEYWWRDTKEP